MSFQTPSLRGRRRSGLRRRGPWAAALALVPESGDLDQFIAAVARHRGRPITLVEDDLPPDEPSGMWLEWPNVDYLVTASALSAEHRRVVICHELAHMLLGHRGPLAQFDTSIIAPSISPEVAARFSARHGYEDHLEADAESLATILAAELANNATTAAARSADNISTRLR